MNSCKHEAFNAEIRVDRIEDIGRFVASVKISCTECGTPFQFMGLQPGLNYAGPTVSLDGLDANIPIHPQGEQPNPLQKLMGYTVNTTDDDWLRLCHTVDI